MISIFLWINSWPALSGFCGLSPEAKLNHCRSLLQFQKRICNQRHHRPSSTAHSKQTGVERPHTRAQLHRILSAHRMHYGTGTQQWFVRGSLQLETPYSQHDALGQITELNRQVKTCETRIVCNSYNQTALPVFAVDRYARANLAFRGPRL